MSTDIFWGIFVQETCLLFFFRLWQKDSRNLAKNLRHGCHFCVYATSRTISAKADFFKKVFVTFVLWAIIPGVPAEISKKGFQNSTLRIQKHFLTFFKYLECHSILGLWKKNFHFLAKGFQKGWRTCLYESNRNFWGERFLLIKISTFYDRSEFRMNIFEHSTKKMGGVAQIAIYLSRWSFWEQKLSEKK